MGRYLLFFSYLGNRYRGLQKQVKDSNVLDVDCVQGALESALFTLKPKLLNPPVFVPSSRTDAGVHSLHNAAHIEIENVKGLLYHPATVLRTLNRHLLRCKHEIRVLQCIPITNQLHARHSAKSRTYLYRLMVAKKFGDRGAPICEMNRCSLVGYENFDIERAKEATKLFVGLRDFRTFAAVNKSERKIQYRRVISDLTIERGFPLLPNDPLSDNFDFWDVKCKGKSFVHNQVRRIVGALCALGAGRVTEKDVVTMLQVPSHNNWNPRITPAAANGLFLVKVEYDPLEIEKNTIKLKESTFFPPEEEFEK